MQTVTVAFGLVTLCAGSVAAGDPAFSAGLDGTFGGLIGPVK